jgi:hypothetical protein
VVFSIAMIDRLTSLGFPKAKTGTGEGLDQSRSTLRNAEHRGSQHNPRLKGSGCLGEPQFDANMWRGLRIE